MACVQRPAPSTYTARHEPARRYGCAEEGWTVKKKALKFCLYTHYRMYFIILFQFMHLRTRIVSTILLISIFTTGMSLSPMLQAILYLLDIAGSDLCLRFNVSKIRMRLHHLFPTKLRRLLLTVSRMTTFVYSVPYRANRYC